MAFGLPASVPGVAVIACSIPDVRVHRARGHVTATMRFGGGGRRVGSHPPLRRMSGGRPRGGTPSSASRTASGSRSRSGSVRRPRRHAVLERPRQSRLRNRRLPQGNAEQRSRRRDSSRPRAARRGSRRPTAIVAPVLFCLWHEHRERDAVFPARRRQRQTSPSPGPTAGRSVARECLETLGLETTDRPASNLAIRRGTEVGAQYLELRNRPIWNTEQDPLAYAP